MFLKDRFILLILERSIWKACLRRTRFCDLLLKGKFFRPVYILERRVLKAGLRRARFDLFKTEM